MTIAVLLLVVSIVIVVVAVVSLVREERERRRLRRDPTAEVLILAMRLHDVAARARRALLDEAKDITEDRR